MISISFNSFRLEFDKISCFFLYYARHDVVCITYVVYTYVVKYILVVVIYVNKCANDKMVEHVFALSGNYRG